VKPDGVGVCETAEISYPDGPVSVIVSGPACTPIAPVHVPTGTRAVTVPNRPGNVKVNVPLTVPFELSASLQISMCPNRPLVVPVVLVVWGERVAADAVPAEAPNHQTASAVIARMPTSILRMGRLIDPSFQSAESPC
jgi:hypothetical protein